MKTQQQEPQGKTEKAINNKGKEQTKNQKLVRLKAGYNQHTSPLQLYTARILNVLIQMKNDNKADSTIKFARKALTFLSKHTSLFSIKF